MAEVVPVWAVFRRAGGVGEKVPSFSGIISGALKTPGTGASPATIGGAGLVILRDWACS